MTSPQWWEHDPDERPIPIDALAAPAQVAAEDIVEAERQAIMREDTQPTLETLASLRRTSSAADARQPRLNPRLVTALLVVGCAATFCLGWSQGSRARAEATPAVTETTSKEGEREFNERSARSKPGDGKEVSER